MADESDTAGVDSMLKTHKYIPEITENFVFKRPPECPVFRPTEEEFKNPLEYIAKIRKVAILTGICKIQPPKGWEPPFCVDVDNFKFTPRVQQLNELEAKTRIRLNFIEQIGKYWALQGTPCTIPCIDKHAVDYFMLYEEVQAAGGLSQVKQKQWFDIAKKLGFKPSKNICQIIKNYYERYLQPFYLFKKGQGQGNVKEKEKRPAEPGPSSPKTKINNNNNNSNTTPPSSPEKDPVIEETELANNKELKRLQFYGAGPKMAGFRTRKNDKISKTRGKKTKYEFDPLAKYVCQKCSRGDDEEKMLICDGCDDSYHTFCLTPPLPEIPEGDWRCPRCVQREVCKPSEAFGFEQAKREYSLYQFGAMADEFKLRYFNMPVYLVPSELVEQEYWRIVATIDEDVTVEYGADLHTLDHGSGFPTVKSRNIPPSDMKYVESGWNLNNLPVLNDCILSHINADISGMKVPWMYVGMCFSTFCWHNEDHWSYSVNYLHWGEPKTWYGVPGPNAVDFEEAMRSKAPELFETQPDLLHQLVTIMNPNLLMERGVPVFRTDQKAGEFVITFPRSYHAGFNQGYNFAEAVNFALPDWLEIGRECIDHYSEQRRYCVFSHDELICKMTSQVQSLSISMAAALNSDVGKMVKTEKFYRKQVTEWGITEQQRVLFELKPDDERQCDHCLTTIFLSSVGCKCKDKENRMSCLRHFKQHCSCGPTNRILFYRYVEKELDDSKTEVNDKLNIYIDWFSTIGEILTLKKAEKPELSEMIELDNEGEKKKYPRNSKYEAFKQAIKEGKTTINLCDLLLAKREAQGMGDFPSDDKVKESELKDLADGVTSLCCKVAHKSILNETLVEVEKFHEASRKILQNRNDPDTKELQSLIKRGKSMPVWLDEMPQLEQKLKQAQWLDKVHSLESCSPPCTEKDITNLLSQGDELLPIPAVQHSITRLRTLLEKVTRWNMKAKQCITTRTTIKRLEKLVSEAEVISVYLPELTAIKDLVKKGREWNNKYNSLRSLDPTSPYVEQMDMLVTMGRNLQIYLEPLETLSEDVMNAKTWIEKAGRIFLRKNSNQKLFDALNPRKEVGIQAYKSKKKKIETISEKILDEAPIDKVTIVANFHSDKQVELRLMEQIRAKNQYKRLNDNGDAKYCFCSKPYSGEMLDCELCKEFYHAKCVNNQKNITTKAKPSSTDIAKFLCPCCVRTRRPRIETVLPLLVDLTSLNVRVREGETLQCLTDNAIHWQERAKTALLTEEVASALAKLSVMNQRVLEAEARRKTERIISNELKKAANNPELQGHLHAISPMSGISSEDSTETEDTKNIKTESNDCDQDPFATNEVIDYGTDFKDSFSSSEHAYSQASKIGPTGLARKNNRKTPLIPRPAVAKLHLSESVRCMLESLMMEGDLLEVSLDETHHIWRILEACSPSHKPLYYENLESKSQTELPIIPKPKPVKRKKEAFGEKLKVVLGNKEKQKRQPVMKTIKKKKPSDGEEPIRKKIRKNIKKDNLPTDGEQPDEDDDEEGGDSSCAAESCLNPSGEEVPWVQCDACELWYHMQCEDLKKEEVNSQDDYNCKKCQNAANLTLKTTEEFWMESDMHNNTWSSPAATAVN